MSTLRALAVTLIGLALASLAQAQEQKLPEPDAAALSHAESTVKRLFRTEYAKTGANDMHDLAIKLVSQAAQTVDDPAARFVLYREAAELGVTSGDLVGG